MQHRQRRLLPLIALAAIVVAACQETTTPRPNAGLTPWQELARLSVGPASQSPYGCNVVGPAPPGSATPYQIIRVGIVFSGRSLATDGSVEAYRFLIGRPGEVPQMAFACRIPRTLRAEKAMEKLLHIEKKYRTERQGPPPPE
jgi:hypothetical protein